MHRVILLFSRDSLLRHKSVPQWGLPWHGICSICSFLFRLMICTNVHIATGTNFTLFFPLFVFLSSPFFTRSNCILSRLSRAQWLSPLFYSIVAVYCSFSLSLSHLHFACSVYRFIVLTKSKMCVIVIRFTLSPRVSFLLLRASSLSLSLSLSPLSLSIHSRCLFLLYHSFDSQARASKVCGERWHRAAFHWIEGENSHTKGDNFAREQLFSFFFFTPFSCSCSPHLVVSSAPSFVCFFHRPFNLHLQWYLPRKRCFSLSPFLFSTPMPIAILTTTRRQESKHTVVISKCPHQERGRGRERCNPMGYDVPLFSLSSDDFPFLPSHKREKGHTVAWRAIADAATSSTHTISVQL